MIELLYVVDGLSFYAIVHSPQDVIKKKKPVSRYQLKIHSMLMFPRDIGTAVYIVIFKEKI